MTYNHIIQVISSQVILLTSAPPKTASDSELSVFPLSCFDFNDFFMVGKIPTDSLNSKLTMTQDSTTLAVITLSTTKNVGETTRSHGCFHFFL